MNRFKEIAVLILMVLLSACTTTYVKSNPPAEFSVAARLLAQSLVAQLKNNEQANLFSSRSFVIDPFIDGDTGDVTKASLEIASIIATVLTEPPNNFKILTLDAVNVNAANYAVVGSTKYEPYEGTIRKNYHMYSSIVNISTGMIVANADSWISNKTIDNVPVDVYKNSPMYIKDSVTQMKIDVAQAPVGSSQGRQYINSSSSLAVTQEAGAEFEKSNYPSAIGLFTRSIALPNGQNMKNFSGLYQAYYRSSQRDAAAQAFYNLFSLAVGSKNVSVKFLFAVNSVNFIETGDLRDQYGIWLQQAARYFAETGKCITIIGHSSHTGAQEYNLKLSLARAQRIQALLSGYKPELAKRIQSLGRGFSENIIGTGTDDAQDAFDRRVMFEVKTCA